MTTTTTTETAAPEVATIEVGPVCTECGCLIAYGDDSGMDPEKVSDAEATAAAIRRDERGGLVVTPAPEDAPSGVFRCALCGNDEYGAGHTLVVIRED